MLNVFLGEQPDNMRQIFDFFAPSGGVVVDVTYGKGDLVSRLDSRYEIHGFDREPTGAARFAEWGALPCPNAYADVWLYDPPYKLDVQSFALHKRPTVEWAERHTVGWKLDHESAIVEARRVLRPGGIAIVKIQNVRYKGLYINHERDVRETLERHEFITRDIMIYLRLAVGVFRNARTPQQCYGFYIIAERAQ